MKKMLIVGITVVVLIALVVILNREIPQVSVTAQSGMPAAGPAPDQVTSIPVQDIVLKDLQGKDVKVSDLRGKVVLLDFWATWCGPCKIEIPWLIELQEKYGSKGFTVLGVDIDPESKEKGFVQHYLETTRYDVNGEKKLINYPVVLGDDSLGDRFGLDGYPTGVLISRDGHVVKVTSGLVEGKDEIAKDIESQF
jgi:cytochrome c biogenesis protein CcmG/thiol:disulfide interchange protein DsbE